MGIGKVDPYELRLSAADGTRCGSHVCANRELRLLLCNNVAPLSSSAPFRDDRYSTQHHLFRRCCSDVILICKAAYRPILVH